MRAVAIDFETANEQRASPCSVGLAWIEDGIIVRVEERLIRPKDMRFSGFNMAIHGIRPQDVVGAAEYPEVMEEFRDDLRDCLLIAHNASFDMSVIRATCDLYGSAYPSVDYLCTLKMAQKLWHQLASHRLNHVAQHVGFAFRHHNAGEDARACAEVALAVARHFELRALRDIPAHLEMTAGRLHAGGYVPCSVKTASHRRKAADA